MRWTLILALLAGCATPSNTMLPRRQTGTHVTACTRQAAVGKYDPRIETWLDDFFALAQKYGSTCHRVKTIRMESQEAISNTPEISSKQVVGYCTGDGHVVLSEDVWNQRGLLFNKALLFHELGHCVLGLDHAPEGAVNLMTPYLLYDTELAEHWAELMKKLFTGTLSFVEDKQDVVFDRHSVPCVQ